MSSWHPCQARGRPRTKWLVVQRYAVPKRIADDERILHKVKALQNPDQRLPETIFLRSLGAMADYNGAVQHMVAPA